MEHSTKTKVRFFKQLTIKMYNVMSVIQFQYSDGFCVCMDGNPETLPGKLANTDGALFYLQKANCGSLTCSPNILY